MDPQQMMPPAGAPPTPPSLPTAGGSPLSMPLAPGQGQPVGPEQKQELLDMISKIRNKLGSYRAIKLASSNKTERVRQELLRQVFEKLQLAGVDLSDPKSVAEFIMKLQQSNPELAKAFEQAMGVLLGDQGGAGFGAPDDGSSGVDLGIPPNMNNQNPNEAIPQKV